MPYKRIRMQFVHFGQAVQIKDGRRCGHVDHDLENQLSKRLTGSVIIILHKQEVSRALIKTISGV